MELESSSDTYRSAADRGSRSWPDQSRGNIGEAVRQAVYRKRRPSGCPLVRLEMPDKASHFLHPLVELLFRTRVRNLPSFHLVLREIEGNPRELLRRSRP